MKIIALEKYKKNASFVQIKGKSTLKWKGSLLK